MHRGNWAYWNVLLAMQFVDMKEMPGAAVDGLRKAVDALENESDALEMYPNERARIEEMRAEFLRRAEQRQREIEAEDEAEYLRGW